MAHPSAYQAVFTFGKHKGSSLGYVKDADPGYLSWMADATVPDIWKTAAKRCLADQPIDDLALPKLRTPSVTVQGRTVASQVGIVLKDKNTAAVQFPYNEEWVNRLKSEIDGRTWNGTGRYWEFPAVHLPKVVKIFSNATVRMSPEVEKRLAAEQQRRSDLDEIRVKNDTELTVDTKLPLYPYQKVGIEFVIRAGGRAMIADTCGLGKTVQAIGLALHEQYKTLIVCPKSVTIQWVEEIKKFTGKDSTVWTTKEIDGHGNNQFHIINYDAVPKQLDKLMEKEFDLLVCDEATYLKNRRTLRAKALLGSWKDRKTYPGIKTKHILFLTATPVLNRPIEAYYLLNVIDPQRFKNFYHFTQRYGGWKMEEPRNLEELHERTKDIVIRRSKNEVDSELPEKQRNDIVILLEPLEQKDYSDMLNELFKKWKFQGKATVSTMPKIQGFLTEKKLPRVKELIDELLQDDRSVLVYSIYIDPLKELVKHYGKQAELLHGDIDAKERRAIVKRIASKKTRVGCFGLKSGGMGLDGLQESVDTVIFLNMDWVPANHEQAEDRSHRHGQKKKVQVYYMICEDTIDRDMRDILDEKQKVIDTVVDGQLVTQARDKSYFREFVRRINKRHKVNNDIEIFDS